MALYYFDVADNGQISADDFGTECADLCMVKVQAIKALAEMIYETLPDGDHHVMTMLVRDEGGDLIFRATLRFDVEVEDHPVGRDLRTTHRLEPES